MKAPLYPLRFKPVYKDYVWGGNCLETQFGRNTGGGICAESWEVACLKDGMSVVENGPLAGRTLESLIAEYGASLVGDAFVGKPFPLLIKLLDAREKLSLQVHPDEVTAPFSGGEPKTEAWYILDALPGAGVYAGFKKGVTPADFESALRNGSLETLLEWIPVSAGQTIFIPGGRVHAIGAGCLILEVQQTSNTTFRLDDWGRIGADGKGRPLHVEEGRKAIRWNLTEPVVCASDPWGGSPVAPSRELLTCRFFRIGHIHESGPERSFELMSGFSILFAEKGRIGLRWDGGEEIVREGQTVFLPAISSVGVHQEKAMDVTIKPLDGEADVILITPHKS